MKLKTKLLKKKAKRNKPYELTKDIEDVGEVTFVIKSITLGQLMTYTDRYPSVHKMIGGMDVDAESLEAMDVDKKIETINDVLEMYNVLVALGVEIKDGDETVEFVVESEDEDDLVPGDVLPQELLFELGQLVIQNFRVTGR